MRSKAKQCKAKQCKAKQSNAKQSKAKQSKAKHSKAKQSKGKERKGKHRKAKFLKLKGTIMDREKQIRDMVQKLAKALQNENVDLSVFKPNHFAALSVYHAIFLFKSDTQTEVCQLYSYGGS